MTSTDDSNEMSFNVVRAAMLSTAAMLSGQGHKTPQIIYGMGSALAELIGITIKTEKLDEAIEGMVTTLKSSAHNANAVFRRKFGGEPLN